MLHSSPSMKRQVEVGDEEDHAARDNVYYKVSTKKLISMRQLVVGVILFLIFFIQKTLRAFAQDSSFQTKPSTIF